MLSSSFLIERTTLHPIQDALPAVTVAAPLLLLAEAVALSVVLAIGTALPHAFGGFGRWIESE